VHLPLEAARVLLDAQQGRLVVLRAAQLEQLAGVPQAVRDRAERLDGVLQALLLAPQLLGALRVGPDLRVLELPVDLYEARLLAVEVKGTSSAPPTAGSGLRACRRGR
jgi:hypothetical protein